VGVGFRVLGFGFTDMGLLFRVQGLGFRQAPERDVANGICGCLCSGL
jgi:hypothetical protein